MRPTALGILCKQRGWTRARLIRELRTAAATQQQSLPSDESLTRMIREWANGRRGLSDFYADLLSVVFGVPFSSGQADPEPTPTDGHARYVDQLPEQLTASAAVDDQLIVVFESQTQALRVLDRQLGAVQLLAQTEAHVSHMSGLMRYSLPGSRRAALAAAVAEAAALAGWQALDLGDPLKSWQHHETAKAAALESGNPAILAHVTAQQAYALLDLGRQRDALALVTSADSAKDRGPALLRSWLSAAKAEMAAAAGDEVPARQALDDAFRSLPAEPTDPELPFVVLDDIHLGRWRGHCLARLGADDALNDLSAALSGLDPTFTRAASALHCDLALAHSVRGEHDLAQAEARQADVLAARTGSERQRRRIRSLLTSGDQPKDR